MKLTHVRHMLLSSVRLGGTTLVQTAPQSVGHLAAAKQNKHLNDEVYLLSVIRICATGTQKW